MRPVVRSFVGMLIVKLPAVTVCDPKVKTATALPAVLLELYKSTASNAAIVAVVHENAADGVQKAIMPVPPVLAGAVALVTVTPPAV
jgi:hypothetical protein